MKNWLFLYFYQSQVFWRLRTTMARISFWIEAKIFGSWYEIKENSSNFQSLRLHINDVQKPLLIALVVSGVFQYINPYLDPYFQEMGVSIPNNGDYVTFLATISGIGGVFIGLYYTGISAIASSIYARVPNNIRDLLAQERSGNVYMHYLSFLSVLGLMLIALNLSGFPKLYLAIPVMTIAAGVGVFAFVKLGQRAFNLFDPTALSRHLFEQLQHWLGVVKAGGFQWHDKVFQNHAHKQASILIDTLETLVDMTASKPHLNGKPFIGLSMNLICFLIYYQGAKRQIPSDSAWYKQRYQHRDWYRTDEYQVSVAHQTGTSIQPDETVDHEWLESKIIPVIRRCIKVNLKAKRYSDLLGLFDCLDDYLGQLASEGYVKKAFSLLDDLTPIIQAQLSIKDEGEKITLEKLALAERFASLPLSIALKYRTMLENMSRQSIENRIFAIRWHTEASIYSQNLPSYYLSRLEWFRPRLAFEREVEGNAVTPSWYCSELVRQVEVDQLVGNTDALIYRGAAFYRMVISESLSQNNAWLTAAIMSREWEYWHKISSQLNIWTDAWDDLSSELHVEGLPWAELDIEKLQFESESRQKELLTQMSKQDMLLALILRPEDFPDYAGKFLHTSGEVAFEALLLNDTELLRGVFEGYLFGCLIQFDKLRPTTDFTDWRTQQDFKVAAAPLLDLMDVSGYAQLMADYHENKDLWDIVTGAWGKYLAQKGSGSPLPLLAIAVTITESAFEIAHRSGLRLNWNQRIKERLADVPRHDVSGRGFRLDTVIDHESALVRIFAGAGHLSYYDGISVFISFYLRSLKGGDDLDFGQRRQNLQKALERAEKDQ